MKFDSIHDNTDCNCIEGAVEDLDNVYARKINKPSIRESDMKSYWEKGRRHADDCAHLCGLKGISMNAWREESSQKVIERYLTTFKITPKSHDSIYLFRFKSGAGLVKHTPSKGSEYHYDFFKSDDFALDLIEEVGVQGLREML